MLITIPIYRAVLPPTLVGLCKPFQKITLVDVVEDFHHDLLSFTSGVAPGHQTSHGLLALPPKGSVWDGSEAFKDFRMSQMHLEGLELQVVELLQMCQDVFLKRIHGVLGHTEDENISALLSS